MDELDHFKSEILRMEQLFGRQPLLRKGYNRLKKRIAKREKGDKQGKRLSTLDRYAAYLHALHHNNNKGSAAKKPASLIGYESGTELFMKRYPGCESFKTKIRNYDVTVKMMNIEGKKYRIPRVYCKCPAFEYGNDPLTRQYASRISRVEVPPTWARTCKHIRMAFSTT